MSAASANQWVVLSRPECSLCEAMLFDIADWLGEVPASLVQVLDISGDEQLERKYGQRLPVLMIDGEFVCAYRLDRERAQAFLKG